MKKLLIFLLLGMFLISFTSASLTNGLVSYYYLDEPSGNIVFDSWGNNDGVLNGRLNSTTGKINTAYSFNGINNYINTTAKTTANYTYSAWIYRNVMPASGQYQAIVSSGAGGLDGWLGLKSDGMLRFHLNGASYTADTATGLITTGEWYHIVATGGNLTNVTIYINGNSKTLTTTGVPIVKNNLDIIIGRSANITKTDFPNIWNGTIDEIGYWNRTLTTDEITELYNSGTGARPFATSPKVTLVSPADGTVISDIGTNFTVTGNNISSVAGTWDNVTFTIWNGSTIHNATTINLNNQTFYETLFIDEFVLGTYTWNAYACYTNSTDTYCIWADDNRTFDVVPFSVEAVNYSPTAIGGSSESFSVNLSVISFERMSTVKFVYNGTEYTVIPTEYATNEWYMPVSLIVPIVSTPTNLTFYWSVRLESGLIYNTTTYTQEVYNIGLDNCSVNTNQLFNLTMRDERLQTLLVGATDNTSIKVSIELLTSGGTQVANFSTFFNKVNPARVCLSYPMGNSTLRMNAVIEYTAVDRFIEFYNIQNYLLTLPTQSQNISLYSLKASEGQEFKMTYKGIDFVPVANVIVQIQRKYIEEGVFKTVEIPMSGSNGFTMAHLVPNDVVYNLIFIKNGVILDTFLDVIATCQNPTFNDCEINLNALVGGSDLHGLVEEDDFFSSLSYTPSTRTISSTYGITSGVSGTTSLEVYLMDNLGTTTVCNDSLIASGGTLSCVIPESFGNGTVKAVVKLNGETRREGFISLRQKPKDLYGGILIFMSVIMILFLLGIGVQENPMIMGVMLVFGLIVMIGLNLVYSTSWLGAGATVLWFVIAVVMILIKGGNKR